MHVTQQDTMSEDPALAISYLSVTCKKMF